MSLVSTLSTQRRRRRTAVDIVLGQITGGMIAAGTLIIFLTVNGYIAF